MWPHENPWLLAVVLITAGVGLLILASQQQQPRYRWLAGLAWIAAIGMFALDLFIVSEREQVQNAIYGITSAFQKGNVEETVDYISPGAEPLRSLVRRGMAIVSVKDDMRVTDLRVTISDSGSFATTRFRVNGTVVLHPRRIAAVAVGRTPSAADSEGEGFQQHEATMWEARWDREDGVWKMSSIQELDPITGRDRNRLERLGRSSGTGLFP